MEARIALASPVSIRRPCGGDPEEGMNDRRRSMPLLFVSGARRRAQPAAPAFGHRAEAQFVLEPAELALARLTIGFGIAGLAFGFLAGLLAKIADADMAGGKFVPRPISFP